MHRQILRPRRAATLALAVAMAGFATAATPLETVDLAIESQNKALIALLQDASALWKRRKQTDAAPIDLFAEAQAEYGLLLESLYNAGYFSPVIHVRLDGREAAGIDPLDVPGRINRVEITVDPGARFTFSQAALRPLARRTQLPTEFAVGQTASTGVMRMAVQEGVEGWRRIGHAKAAVADQNLTVDHDTATLAADIVLEPGPLLRFGPLTIQGNDRMRTNRIRKVTGLTEGDTFSSLELERAADRLRRTGVFSSVTLTEDDAITAPDLIGITLDVTEAKRRRYSFGAEISTNEGLNITGDWLHRNLFDGGERFNIGFEVANITPSFSGTDYTLGISLERPASPFPDTTGGVSLDLSHMDEADYLLNSGDLGLNFNHVFSSELQVNVGLGYSFVNGTDALGEFTYRSLELPLGATWDRRDSKTDPTRMFYLNTEVKPFMGFGITENGTRITFDARGYYAVDAASRAVVAGRVQGGTILGASPLGAPRDELFYSGGGGTVRGQPYQSLGITVPTTGGPLETGGTTFLAGSLEGRFKVTDSIGMVAFFDIGTVSDGGLGNGGGAAHSGAGLGLRYATGFGPIRLDVAAPVGGTTGNGVQIYVGLGQSF